MNIPFHRIGLLILLLWVAIATGHGGLAAPSGGDPLRLTVFFTNDIHGGIVPQKAEFLNPEFPPALGGGASAAAIIQQVRHQGRPVLLIDAGDIFQGTLVGTLSKGQTVVQFMNMMRYDATVPGNHDFDLGKDNLIELIKASHFPWVSANIYDRATGRVWAWVKPWVIIEKGGLRIGFTGATTTGTEKMSFPEHIRGLEFRPEIPALQAAVDSLRARGVDLVVAMVHTGLPYDLREGYRRLQQTSYTEVLERGYANAMEIAHFVHGIDLLLGGHLHKGIQTPWEDPVTHTICVQNYGNFGNLGWIDLLFDPPTRALVGYQLPSDNGMLLLLQEDEFWPDTTVAAFIRMQQQLYEKGFEEVIGETRTALVRSSNGEAPLNNLITDAMRWRGEAEMAFTNYGGIRANIKRGPITRADIFRVLPFGNQIVVFQATGRQIKQILEAKVRGGRRGLAVSGARVVVNKSLPDGQRVVSVTIGGQPLEPERTYRVATTDYLMEGNSGLSMLAQVPREQVAYTGILLREAVIEYIRRNSPLNVQPDGRWKWDESAKPSPDWLQKYPPVPAYP